MHNNRPIFILFFSSPASKIVNRRLWISSSHRTRTTDRCKFVWRVFINDYRRAKALRVVTKNTRRTYLGRGADDSFLSLETRRGADGGGGTFDETYHTCGGRPYRYQKSPQNQCLPTSFEMTRVHGNARDAVRGISITTVIIITMITTTTTIRTRRRTRRRTSARVRTREYCRWEIARAKTATGARTFGNGRVGRVAGRGELTRWYHCRGTVHRVPTRRLRRRPRRRRVVRSCARYRRRRRRRRRYS